MYIFCFIDNNKIDKIVYKKYKLVFKNKHLRGDNFIFKQKRVECLIIRIEFLVCQSFVVLFKL